MRRAWTLLLAVALTGCTIPVDEEEPDVVVTVTETETTDPVPAPVPAQESVDAAVLEQAVTAAITQYGGSAGVAVSDGVDTWQAGEMSATPAWSTVKVPLAIAALRINPELAPSVSAAIRISDNAAAETLWQVAGPAGVDAVLAEGQAGTAVNQEVLRPEFSIFGQTPWSPADQARFAAHLPCIAGAETVLADMAAVDPSQAWGLGIIPGARFKGGWGPDFNGVYTARQLGLVPAADGKRAVAVAATPASGSFADAQAMTTIITEILGDMAELPVARC
ncbi:MAG: hypothetical protein Q4G50_06605 [Corynebacterium sp.]|uniref:hypothetical protein n=1 Tax=Corynebacterium sp. TaxID=1720 RepID=UPI0026E0DC38|nr:hypothetical protein [Corynebacterium sp.]MDO5669656.1 hypothetical protein [Corynebacterium sp.]